MSGLGVPAGRRRLWELAVHSTQWEVICWFSHPSRVLFMLLWVMQNHTIYKKADLQK